MCFLFLDPQDAVGPSISFSVVLCSFVLLVYIVVLVLVFCLCPSSVRVIVTFSGTVLFPLLCKNEKYTYKILEEFIIYFNIKCQYGHKQNNNINEWYCFCMTTRITGRAHQHPSALIILHT